MKKNRTLNHVSGGFVIMSILSLSSVTLMAFASPQAVMDLVQVSLTNNDALSSIRGIYGGVGATLVISLIYLLRTNKLLALKFLCLFWGFYAFSRLITILHDGALGSFGTQWLLTETVFFMIALLLLLWHKRQRYAN
jgi:hypothetical protein